MKKLMFLFLTSIFLLAACSSTPDSTDGGKKSEATAGDEITAWAWDPNFNIAALDIATEIYKKDKADFNFKVIESAQEDVVQKLNTALSSGTTKGLPDIVLIEDYRAQSFLQAYPDAFYELTGLFNADDFSQYKIAPTSLNGKNYGVPFDSGVTGLYVRTDYLKEAGYTLEDLQDIDWREYIEIGKKVKEVTGKDFMTIDPNDIGLVRIMMQSAGSWYTKEDGVTPNIEGNVALKEALIVFKEIMDANFIKPNSDWNQYLATFNGDHIATVLQGNWITPSIKAEASQSGKWAVVPIPTLNVPGGVGASNLGGSSWYVLNGEGAEVAADYLAKTFGSSEELYQRLVTEIGAIGTYQPVASSDAYKYADEFFGGQSIIEDLAAWSLEIPSVNYGMHTYGIDDIIEVEVQNYLNGKTIDDVLKDAQKQADAQFK